MHLFSSFFHFRLYSTSRISDIAVPHFVYKNGPCGDWGTKENFYMKKLVFLLLIVIGFSSCVLNRTYISDYREQIRLMKANFPEIYELYRQGDVIITSVYTYEKDGQERVHIEYRYR